MANKRPIIVIAGVQREMNDEEFAQYEADQAETAAKLEAQAAAEAARQALLDKLGLTAEEAKLLLNG